MVKLVTWNCQGGLRNKTHYLDALCADVLVVQECEDPSRSTPEYRKWAGDFLWIGESKNKGIGVFPRQGYVVEKLGWDGDFSLGSVESKSPLASWRTSDLKLFLPFKINHKFTVLGVWTKGKKGEVFGYIGQFWKYLQVHRGQLNQENTIILGDLNSNKKWDVPERVDAWWNHASVVGELKNISLESLYHYQTCEAHGAESISTYFHQRKVALPHHIDYVFCSKDILSNCVLDIKNPAEWINISDHVPLVVNINS